MQILFIGKRHYTNRDAYKERFGRIYQIPLHLAKRGYKIRLWLIDYHGKAKEQRQEDQLHVISTPVASWSALHSFISETLQKKRRPNIIIASGDCYIGLLGIFIARVCGARFIFDIYDAYDTFGAYRSFPGFSPIEFLVRRSDICLFASRALRDRFSKKVRASALVPNGIDLASYSTIYFSDRHQFALPENSSLIGYFGSMEPDRGVDDLIAAVQILRARGRSIDIVLAGRLNPDINIQFPGVHYLGNLPPEAVPQAMAICDLLALPYRRSPFLDMAASCKIAEYIAVRRPLVATRTPNLISNFPSAASLIESALADPGDVDSLARAIDWQITNKIIADTPHEFDWNEILNSLIKQLQETGIIDNPIKGD